MVNPWEADWTERLRARLDDPLVEYRATLTTGRRAPEDEARRSLAPSPTTELALVTYMSYVENVGFCVIVNPGHDGALETETLSRHFKVSGATTGVPDGR